ncbi:MAG: YcxB family protein [Verrucomicrobia bacterium]|nr:YcxB family protein [Verrucomicrobiota bacterium]
MEPTTNDNLIQYQMTREEVVAQMWRLMLLPGIIVPMTITFLFGIGMFALLPNHPIWSWIFIIFPVAFLIAYRRTVHKIVDQHPEYLEQQTLSFDEKGISIRNSVFTVQWSWDRARGVKESKEFIVIRFCSYGSGAVIRKSALTAQQRERLLSYTALSPSNGGRQT